MNRTRLLFLAAIIILYVLGFTAAVIGLHKGALRP